MAEGKGTNPVCKYIFTKLFTFYNISNKASITIKIRTQKYSEPLNNVINSA